MFTQKIAAKLLASAKISGLVLYKLLTNPVKHFTHDKVCPNDLSNLDGTCAKNWNEYGTGLNYVDFPFPIFFARDDNDVVKIRDCFVKFNNFSYEQHSERSLCAIEIKSFMFAATSTPVCLRRSNSILNVNPVKFCDPLAGDNVWASLFPIAEENQTRNDDSQKFIILAARTDTTSLFYELMPGASNPITGIVSLLSTAKLLKMMFQHRENQKFSKTFFAFFGCFCALTILFFVDTNVLFVFFSGESYDYLGSQRFLYDMENDEFPVDAANAGDLIPQIRPENISLFIEFSQLSHSGGVYAHVLENNSQVSMKKKSLQLVVSLTQSCLQNKTSR